jgi:ATP-binding cassette subfamily B protein
MFKQYRTILPYLRKYRTQYVLGLLCLVIVDAAQLLIPQFVRQAINLISAGAFDPSAILRLALLMVAVAACISSGRFLWRFFIHGSSRRIETEMRDRLFDHLLELSGSFYQANKTGDLMARATNDMGAIRQATGMGFVTLVDGSFMAVAILAIMIVQNPDIALLTIIPLPIITVLIIFFGSMVGKRFERVQAIYSRLSEIAQETMAGIRVVKAFVKEGKFAADFSSVNDDYRDASMNLVTVFGFFFPFISFLSGLTILILLSVGGNAVIGNRMSAGDIVAMLAYLQMLVWPMMGAGFTVNTLQRGAASLKRVNEILEAEPDIVSAAGAVSIAPSGEVEFRSLTFCYGSRSSCDEDRRNALEDVSVSIARGQTLGILGRVGSGKSTLLRVLPRLIDPPPGTVFVGGRDVRDLDLSMLRRAFGFVPQDSFLFSDSIAANIRYGAPGLSQERFARVASISTIDRDVADFPAGWDTVVGEKGLTLSGGQKQRIAIARALAVDPEILVLDDALSAVDAETEDNVLAGLMEERRGRTNIIVSHRVSTLRHADVILVLENGRVAQRGGHMELLADESGFYAEIARLQELERVAEKGE